MNATITYRKTSQGKWVAYGPAAAVAAGTEVSVTKASGHAKTEYITSTGRTFRVDGCDMVYGYIGEKPAPESRSGCAADPERCGCKTYDEHCAHQDQIAAGLNARPRRPGAAQPLAGRCKTCRCHREPGAGRPGTILYDGCGRCGCEAA